MELLGLVGVVGVLFLPILVELASSLLKNLHPHNRIATLVGKLPR